MPMLGIRHRFRRSARRAQGFQSLWAHHHNCDGIGRWTESYNQDRDKFLTFIERYNLTISHSRMAWFTLAEAPPTC